MESIDCVSSVFSDNHGFIVLKKKYVEESELKFWEVIIKTLFEHMGEVLT